MTENQINLKWDLITKEELIQLFLKENQSKSQIAKLYNVSVNQVKSKLDKWNIKKYPSYYLIKNAKNEKEITDILNEKSLPRLNQKENISWIAKALTHHIFRNGPIEDMHAAGKLTQEDMKALNKYMVNKIAGLLLLANKGEWIKIELLLNFYKYWGSEWDEAEPDIKDIEYMYKNQLELLQEEMKAFK